MTDLALAHLKKRDPARPVFGWIHYTDPHAPYRFHREFSQESLLGLDRSRQVLAKYDSEVAFTDHHLGRLLETLRQENAVIVFVADHGESLYEHGYLGHGRQVYQASMRVPLLIVAPEVRAGRSNFPARGVDIAPTVLALAGLPSVPGMVGLNILGEGVPKQRLRVMETYPGDPPPGMRRTRGPDRPSRANEGPLCQGIVSWPWKLIVRRDGEALFNLEADPMEAEPASRQHPERVRDLKAKLDRWNAETPSIDTGEARFSEDDVEALKALGYLE